MKSTNKIYKKLLDNLHYPFLFFFPKELKILFKEQKELSQIEKIFDVLAVFDINKENYKVEKGHDLSFLLQKFPRLESNMFLLTDAKSNLSEIQFNFLLKKYKSQIDLWTYFASEFATKSKFISDPIFIKNKFSFINQKAVFKLHQKEIEESFVNCGKRRYSLDAFLELFKSKEERVEEKKMIKKKATKIENKKKKHPIVSNEEVDAYLLKQLFSIDVEKLNGANQ